MKLSEFPLGFEIDGADDTVLDALKVVRLLHIKELRILQTKINEMLVAIQDITARPKVSQKLGKVGW